jgi:hypothetical protein
MAAIFFLTIGEARGVPNWASTDVPTLELLPAGAQLIMVSERLVRPIEEDTC